MLDQFVSLSEAEMVDVIGGGGISDLVVRFLTWCGDELSEPAPPVTRPSSYYPY